MKPTRVRTYLPVPFLPQGFREEVPGGHRDSGAVGGVPEYPAVYRRTRRR